MTYKQNLRGNNFVKKRIFVAKKPEFNVKNQSLLRELQYNLQLKTLSSVKMIQVYDVFHVADDLLDTAEKTIFSEQVTDDILTEASIKQMLSESKYFAIESLPGQFDQRASSAEAALSLLGADDQLTVKTAQLYLLNETLSDDEFEQIKKYQLNSVDSRFKAITTAIHDEALVAETDAIPILDGFINYSKSQITELHASYALAMEVADLLWIQDYFKQVNRDPSETELKVLDTYWSDHTRHTTFETELKTIDFSKSKFAAQLQATFNKYLKMRKALNRDEKPTTLMELATIFGRFERANSRLDDMEVSDEINACSVEIAVDVNGVKEPWLLMFKNETHNHPTEIEPFGGASTCIGGAIRDPLSGRAYVYQAMRITGAGDITAPISDTRTGKLPQQVISKDAAHGYSSYGNQIGLATTYVKEYFHPGFVAKRLETGAVVGAAPKENVLRLKPEAGDAIVIFGGKTGRDGVGGATGSSKVQTKETVESAGAEVQKGNAIEERKIQRLFRNPTVTQLIKKSNDFGAGGVCVAIGELADGVKINLDKVPLKYQGLTGTEIAISESQERMSVVVSSKDVAQFISECEKENILAVQVAEVTEKANLTMVWKGKTIVDIERSFLDTNGVRVVVDASVIDSDLAIPFNQTTSRDSLSADLNRLFSDMNFASQKGLQTIFDSSIGRSTVIQPVGGRYQLTPAESSVQKLPVLTGITNTVSLLSHGYNPEIATWSPYHGAAYAVIEATSRLVATDGDWSKARFSYQEYFERMDKKAERFGKPLAALLGAIEAQSQLGLPAIGGKDSMSGTFEELTVPPTLIAFGVTTSEADRILSPEFKAAGEHVYYIPGVAIADVIDWERVKDNFNLVSQLQKKYTITAAISTKAGGFSEAIGLMTFGNRIGATVEIANISEAIKAQYAGFILTSPDEISELEAIGRTTSEFTLTINGVSISAHELQDSFEHPLEKVYPTLFEQSQELPVVETRCSTSQIKSTQAVEKPVVYIPVFPGTNCEYDTAKAFEAAGAVAKIVPFKTLSIIASIQEMVKHISKANILMFAGGFSAADEPDGSAKFIVNILLNADVKTAIDVFIARGGLILGICNGFQALVKSGLLPYGEFDKLTIESPTLFYNDANQHVAKMVETKIVNTNSPWLSKVSVGDIHAIPVSHGEGKFVVTPEVFDELNTNGQIITQYVDFNGNATMDSSYNPNGSVAAIEGIISKNGQILGKMGHSERYESGLFKNIPGNKDQKLFESAVAYFKK